MDNNTWTNIHQEYSRQDWIHKPSIFAEEAIEYFPAQGKVLELGAGHGQDSLFFASRGYSVTSTDFEIASLKENIANAAQDIQQRISVQTLDLRQPFQLDDTFDVVYAHLSLHYFDQKTTERIFEDIYSSLQPNGVLAFFTNSVEDPEYSTGTQLEEHFFAIDGVTKRYFTVEEAREFAYKFIPILADNGGETYKDAAKGIHRLIRFVGKKR